MRKVIVDTLSTGSSASAEYREAVKNATVLELKAACSRMYGKARNKTRIMSCESELRRRNCINFERSTEDEKA